MDLIGIFIVFVCKYQITRHWIKQPEKVYFLSIRSHTRPVQKLNSIITFPAAFYPIPCQPQQSFYCLMLLYLPISCPHSRRRLEVVIYFSLSFMRKRKSLLQLPQHTSIVTCARFLSTSLWLNLSKRENDEISSAFSSIYTYRRKPAMEEFGINTGLPNRQDLTY